jgi:hypothetical protein
MAHLGGFISPSKKIKNSLISDAKRMIRPTITFDVEICKDRRSANQSDENDR